ncbi:hypothetical protein FBU59_000526 [Linderina macrospora]|uniref:Uncharacterized protein n=1 Tax=Linderina macrospora TaxID=4868 RepID=A0ACC1JGM0_9FUNG|nr:hypothetical protein FBU59_000526 [Linderina macrospora]
MYRTVSELRNHELSGAINWAVSNRAQLEGCEINLEFGLHELRFLQLIEQGQTSDALKYAREWFPRFAGTQESLGAAAVTGGNSGSSKDSVHLGEIQHLMGIFIYAKDLAQSPYADKFDPQRWEEGARGFASAFCTLLGLASESPLGVAVGAGARALPVVCKMSGLMRSRHVEWSAQDELAVEVALPDSMRFHSVFACPVSKEQATSANPPMMMPCGHVVCKLSLDRLARGVRPGAVASGRFKCPYCPSMSTLSDAKRVFF